MEKVFLFDSSDLYEQLKLFVIPGLTRNSGPEEPWPLSLVKESESGRLGVKVNSVVKRRSGPLIYEKTERGFYAFLVYHPLPLPDLVFDLHLPSLLHSRLLRSVRARHPNRFSIRFYVPL